MYLKYRQIESGSILSRTPQDKKTDFVGFGFSARSVFLDMSRYIGAEPKMPQRIGVQSKLRQIIGAESQINK